MKVISSKVHGVLDYLTVIFLILSPSIFNMDDGLRTCTYVLAGLQLIVSILTDYEPGLIKVIPFKVHGLIEMAAAVILAIIAFLFLHNDSETGFYFYLVLAVIYLIVFILTDFREKNLSKVAV